MRISSFICPCDTPYEKTGYIAILPTVGTLWAIYLSGGGADSLGRTNYFGVYGWWGKTGDPDNDPFHGVFWNRSKTGFDGIPDGSSNTLLFGEDNGGDTASFAWFGAHARGHVLGSSRRQRLEFLQQLSPPHGPVLHG